MKPHGSGRSAIIKIFIKSNGRLSRIRTNILFYFSVEFYCILSVQFYFAVCLALFLFCCSHFAFYFSIYELLWIRYEVSYYHHIES